MNIIHTLKWLFKNPPTNITSKCTDGIICDYCGSVGPLSYYEGLFAICHKCFKLMADKTLKQPEERPENDFTGCPRWEDKKNLTSQ